MNGLMKAVATALQGHITSDVFTTVASYPRVAEAEQALAALNIPDDVQEAVTALSAAQVEAAYLRGLHEGIVLQKVAPGPERGAKPNV